MYSQVLKNIWPDLFLGVIVFFLFPKYLLLFVFCFLTFRIAFAHMYFTKYLRVQLLSLDMKIFALRYKLEISEEEVVAVNAVYERNLRFKHGDEVWESLEKDLKDIQSL